MYIRIIDDNANSHNLQLSRLVGEAFVDGKTAENNTINHIDGDIRNNVASNLEWVSQSENDRHAYRALHRSVVKTHRYMFNKIVYKGKYEFKTVSSFAKFLGKSETQTRGYLDNCDRYEIELI